MFCDIFVIGAGGTGTYFLKEFSRFVSGNKDALKQIASMHIFDGDVVEQKNLARQAFVPDDVGRNKASVMAEVLNDSFGLSFVSHAAYVTDKAQITDCFSKSVYARGASQTVVPVIISCVDNHGCRLLLEEIFKEVDNCILFDSGNEYDTGEVVFSYKSDKTVYGPERSFYFPDIKEGDVRGREEMSCEELNSVAPQHIFTNMLAGNLLCSGVSNLLAGKITPGFTYFNAFTYETGFVAFQKSVAKQKKSAVHKKAQVVKKAARG